MRSKFTKLGLGIALASAMALGQSAQAAPVSDAAIEAFLGLAAGSIDGISTGNATQGSAMKTSFVAAAGDVITADWNFLTNENTPTNNGVNDLSFVSITVDGVLQVLANTQSGGFAPSGTVFTDETGYNSFSHTMVGGGLVEIGFGVVDLGDTILDSGLLIDNVAVNGGLIGDFETTLGPWAVIGNTNTVTAAFGTAPSNGNWQACMDTGPAACPSPAPWHCSRSA
jgi:hypothetical protein